MIYKSFFDLYKPQLDSTLRYLAKHPEYLSTKDIKFVANGDTVDGITRLRYIKIAKDFYKDFTWKE